MKTIADDIAEIIAKRIFLAFLLIVFFYFAANAYIGIRDRHDTLKAKAQAYVEDVQRVAAWVESERGK